MLDFWLVSDISDSRNWSLHIVMDQDPNLSAPVLMQMG